MNFTWWQTLIVGILLFAGGFFTRQWTFVPPAPKAPPSIVKEGPRDTVYVPAPEIKGEIHGTSVVKQDIPVKRDTGVVVGPKMSYYYEGVVDTSINHTHINIRSRTYPYIEGDSLRAVTYIEFNVQPRPVQIITKTDTVYTMQEVEVPAKPAFFARPEIAYPLGIAIGVIGTVLIIKETK